MTQVLKLTNKGIFKNCYKYIQVFKGKDGYAKGTVEGSQKRTRNIKK